MQRSGVSDLLGDMMFGAVETQGVRIEAEGAHLESDGAQPRFENSGSYPK